MNTQLINMRRFGANFLASAPRAAVSISYWFIVSAAVGVFVMMVSTTVDVGGRFLFSNPIAGVVELNQLLLILTVFGGIAYCQAVDKHITIEFLFTRFSPRLQASVQIFTSAVMLLFFGVITFYAGARAYHSLLIGEYSYGSIPFPLWPSGLILSLGLFLLTLQFLIGLHRGVARLIALNCDRRKF